MENEKEAFYRRMIEVLIAEASAEQLKTIYAFLAAYIR